MSIFSFKKQPRKNWQKVTRGKLHTKEKILTDEQNLSNKLAQHGMVSALVCLVPFVALFQWDTGLITGRFSSTSSYAFLLFAGGVMAWMGVVKLFPEFLRNTASFNRFLGVTAVYILFTKLVFLFNIPVFFAPLVFFAMGASVIFSRLFAVYLVSCLALLTALMSPHVLDAVKEGNAAHEVFDYPLFLSLLIGGLFAVIATGRVRSQSKPVGIGFFAGLLQAMVILLAKSIRDPSLINGAAGWNEGGFEPYFQVLLDPFFGFSGALICGIAMMMALPVLESFFDLLTERRLLELADLSNELLTTFALRAPGSFTHCQNVAHLASEATKVIGGDHLLSRVGAYYHDVGKIFKPEYFTENCIIGSASPHDQLSPEMSRLVLMSHVKEGQNIAEEEKLPAKIKDMISMHHGTTIVRYFYQKAKDQADVGARHGTDMENYRYPGPKPTFKEAGVLMLADAIEAASRSLKDPSAVRLRDLVNAMIVERLESGELDHSELTLLDLSKIKESFTRTLSAQIFHGRIPYPRAEKEEKGEEGEKSAKSESRAGAGR